MIYQSWVVLPRQPLPELLRRLQGSSQQRLSSGPEWALLGGTKRQRRRRQGHSFLESHRESPLLGLPTTNSCVSWVVQSWVVQFWVAQFRVAGTVSGLGALIPENVAPSQWASLQTHILEVQHGHLLGFFWSSPPLGVVFFTIYCWSSSLEVDNGSARLRRGMSLGHPR